MVRPQRRSATAHAFKYNVERIGYYNFVAQAGAEELAADVNTRGGQTPLQVWAGRRELFMLRNLQEALTKTPRPVITTMGAAHARNQKAKIEALLSPYNGILVIGDIGQLAAAGAVRPV